MLDSHSGPYTFHDSTLRLHITQVNTKSRQMLSLVNSIAGDLKTARPHPITLGACPSSSMGVGWEDCPGEIEHSYSLCVSSLSDTCSRAIQAKVDRLGSYQSRNGSSRCSSHEGIVGHFGKEMYAEPSHLAQSVPP